jgi:hypothetical protein
MEDGMLLDVETRSNSLLVVHLQIMQQNMLEMKHDMQGMKVEMQKMKEKIATLQSSTNDLLQENAKVAPQVEGATHQNQVDISSMLEAVISKAMLQQVKELNEFKDEYKVLQQQKADLEKQVKSSQPTIFLIRHKKDQKYPRYLDEGGVFPRNKDEIASMTHTQITLFAKWYGNSEQFGNENWSLCERQQLLTEWIALNSSVT